MTPPHTHTVICVNLRTCRSPWEGFQRGETPGVCVGSEPAGAAERTERETQRKRGRLASPQPLQSLHKELCGLCLRWIHVTPPGSPALTVRPPGLGCPHTVHQLVTSAGFPGCPCQRHLQEKLEEEAATFITTP